MPLPRPRPGGGGARACAHVRTCTYVHAQEDGRKMQRPSSALVRRKAASEERQHRPRTSLGFARKSDVCCKGSQLVGFDVSEYFRRHGSSAGLHIGVNGRPSGDVALRSYVEDCRLEALVRELEEEEEKEWVTGWKKKTGGSESHIQQQAPLCWDALLEKTEARQNSLRPNKLISSLHL